MTYPGRLGPRTEDRETFTSLPVLANEGCNKEHYMKLSTGIVNQLIDGKEGGLLGNLPDLLAKARLSFEQGDRWQLWEVLYYCALFQATVPDWAVDALIEVNSKVADGRSKGLDDALGDPPLSQRQRQRAALRQKHAGEVIRLAYKMRDEGSATLNSQDRELIAKPLGLSGKDVQEILRTHKGAGLKQKAMGKNEGYAVAYGSFPLTEFRRRGRPLL